MELLLLDDDPAILFMVVTTLKKKDDFQVDTAENTTEAFNFLAEKKYDVILSDFMMDDMDGDEFIKTLKLNNEFKEIPVIFLTAKNDEESIKQFKVLGAKGVIIKPFIPGNLNSQILSILHEDEFYPV